MSLISVENIFYLIVSIIIFSFVLERFLDYLNATMWSEKLPDQVKSVFSAEKYEKQQKYQKTKHYFSMVSSSFSFIVNLMFIIFFAYSAVDSYIRENITNHFLLLPLLYFGFFTYFSQIISIPFSVYSTFVIEEKFGFNKTTAKTFVFDFIKKIILVAIIGGGVFSIVVIFFEYFGTNFWLYTWIFISLVMVFFVMFYSTLIVPLFNKQTALEEGELRSAIQKFCETCKFKLDEIYTIDGSKRSTKSNAYFTGFGPKKRVVLFDTLVNELSTEEICAVLAHEIGHYRKKHIFIGLFINIAQIGIMLYALSLTINSPLLINVLGPNVQIGSTHIHISLQTFMFLLEPIGIVISVLQGLLMRKMEYQADNFAKKQRGNMNEHLIGALKKLAKSNLANLTPHPAYVFFHYTHPPLLDRLDNLAEMDEEKKEE